MNHSNQQSWAKSDESIQQFKPAFLKSSALSGFVGLSGSLQFRTLEFRDQLQQERQLLSCFWFWERQVLSYSRSSLNGCFFCWSWSRNSRVLNCGKRLKPAGWAKRASSGFAGLGRSFASSSPGIPGPASAGEAALSCFWFWRGRKPSSNSRSSSAVVSSAEAGLGIPGLELANERLRSAKPVHPSFGNPQEKNGPPLREFFKNFSFF